MKKFVAVSSFAAVASASQANPIRKVVTLLQDMQKEVQAEGEKEADMYEKFMCFCKKGTGDMDQTAKDAAAKIEELTNKAAENKAEKEQLIGELQQHEKDRADARADLASATNLRKKENEAYVAAAGDTKANIEALNGAVAALKKGMGAAFLQTPAAASLKRVINELSELTDSSDRETVMSFLEQGKDFAPQSGQIVGILANMKDEMDKSLGGIVGDEEAAVKAFDELKAAKRKEIEAAGAAIEAKTERKGALAVAIVQAEAAKDNATRELSDSQAFAADLAVNCKQKTADWEVRSKTRADELVAIGEAIKVLNDDDALTIFNKTLKKDAAPAAMGFLQKNTKKSAIKTAKNIFSALRTSNSPLINLMANTVTSKLQSADKNGSAAKGTMDKVIKLIETMVEILTEEQTADRKHKDFCTVTLLKTEQKKKDNKREAEGVEHVIKSEEGEIKKLTEWIAESHKEVIDYEKEIAEATAQRKAEAAEYQQAKTLNNAAIQLIFKAKNRLQKFYNPKLHVKKAERELTEEERIFQANGGTLEPEEQKFIAGTTIPVFVQIHNAAAVDPPQAPEEYGDFKKKSGKNSSVTALMDMLSKELEKDQQERDHDEKTAQRDYEKFIAGANEALASEKKSITDDTASKSQNEADKQEKQEMYDGLMGARKEIVRYEGTLHGSCDFIIANFDVRKEARTNEKLAMQNAKATLSGAQGEDFSL